MQINSIAPYSTRVTPRYSPSFSAKRCKEDYFDRADFSAGNKKDKTWWEKTKNAATLSGTIVGLTVLAAGADHYNVQQAKRRNYTKELAPITINERNFNDFSVPMVKGRALYCLNKISDNAYHVVENAGINEFESTEEEVLLAKYAKEVAYYMETLKNCYTGTKHALWSAGVINDYSDMKRGGGKDANEYFASRPKQFRQLDVDTVAELKSLPAGKIIVYSHPTLPGHAAITNGNRQEMSDHTSNMGWMEVHPDGEFKVYELTKGWKIDKDTKKLTFVEE